MNQNHKKLGLKIFGFHALILLAMIAFDIHTQNLAKGSSSFLGSRYLAAWSFHVYWALEYLLISSLLLLSLGARRWIRYPVYLLSYLAHIGIALQLMSVKLSQNFISDLALENILHISLLLNVKTISGLTLAIICFLIPLLILDLRLVPHLREYKARRQMTVLLGVAMLSFVIPLALSQDVLERRNDLAEERMTGDLPPLTSLARTLFLHSKPPIIEEIVLTESAKQVASQLGISLYSGGNKKLPLLKNFVYEKPFPYPAIKKGGKNPNIVLIFMEGTSSRLLGFNQKKYSDITPNIDAFATNDRSMIVDNYFNHTAATYRGLHGQFCSIYPTEGGPHWEKESGNKRPKNLCMPHVLTKVGYDTSFFDCHKKGAAFLDELALGTGFERVYLAEDMQRDYLAGETAIRPDAVSDDQLFRALTEHLKAKDKGDNAKPFFLSLYNLGTHANQEASPDGPQYGDNSNSVLSNIHSYDRAFGKFWDWLKSSEYYENTIVILTADHAHYPEPDHIKAVEGEPYYHYFIDRIPFIIYSPFHDLPPRFDADHRTSLDFAPSLTHLLGIKNFPNHFIGSSIFESNEKRVGGIGVANFGDEYYVAHEEGITRDVESFSDIGKDIISVIDFTKYLEQVDRLWDEQEEVNFEMEDWLAM